MARCQVLNTCPHGLSPGARVPILTDSVRFPSDLLSDLPSPSPGFTCAKSAPDDHTSPRTKATATFRSMRDLLLPTTRCYSPPSHGQFVLAVQSRGYPRRGGCGRHLGRAGAAGHSIWLQ